MRLFLFTTIVCLLCYSCKKSPEAQLHHLNGYWEVVSATNADNVTKTFTINQTIDYIQIEDNKGFRKKLQPSLDGSFETTKSSEAITARIVDDRLELHYKTPFANRYEVVIKATAKELIVENDRKIRYVYKRYTPVKVE